MTFTTLFIDKGGIKKDIPGFSDNFAASDFGFWGEYSLLDFALYNILPEKSIFICDKDIRKNINNVLSKWEEKNCDFFPYNSNYEYFDDFFSRIDDEIIVVYDINFAAVLENKEFIKAVEDFNIKKTVKIEKISVNTVPVDIYIADKKVIEELAESMKNRMHDKSNIFDFLIDEILANGFNEMKDLSGQVLFNSSISQIYKNNISLLKNEQSEIMESFMNKSPAPAERESYITEKGKVINSIISSNARIEGYVENSVIFSGVTVKNDTVIRNSVIMNGNQIGKNVSIENSIVLPDFRQTGSNSNIQDKCIIGAKASKAKNTRYPEQINEGLTVIGMNSSVPSKFIAEPGSLIGADIAASRLKELKTIKKSGSVL